MTRLLTTPAPAAKVKRVAICGTNAAALRASDQVRQRGDEMVCFFDEDERKQGRTFLGHPVSDLQSLRNLTVDELIVTSDRRADVQRQLIRLGFDDMPLRAVEVGPMPMRMVSVNVHVQSLRAAANRKGPVRRRKVVIFGAGAGGQQAFSRVKRLDDVVAFADNDRRKHGTRVLDTPVVGIPELAGMDYDSVVVASVQCGGDHAAVACGGHHAGSDRGIHRALSGARFGSWNVRWTSGGAEMVREYEHVVDGNGGGCRGTANGEGRGTSNER